MGQALTQAMVTTYDIERRTPLVLKSWKEEHAGLPMRHAARATSAAPTFFEPAIVQIGSERRALIDGGMCIPNPAVAAYAEARRIFGPEASMLVVSIGSGVATRPIRYEEARRWGILEWTLPVISLVYDGMASAADYQMGQLLGNKHYRFQIPLHLASDDIDNASAANLRALEQQAIELIENQRAEIEDVCALL
jgi:patatin-like phospholipase/acyl hydrolase